MASKSEFDLKLINAVQSRPILWNSTSEEFKFAEKKAEEWGEIAVLQESDISE